MFVFTPAYLQEVCKIWRPDLRLLKQLFLGNTALYARTVDSIAIHTFDVSLTYCNVMQDCKFAEALLTSLYNN